jgi:hypothetical protein
MKRASQDRRSMSNTHRLHRVYDFGLSEEEEEAVRARRAPTEREIAMMVVDEIALKRLGRWGGHSAPPRWVPR